MKRDQRDLTLTQLTRRLRYNGIRGPATHSDANRPIAGSYYYDGLAIGKLGGNWGGGSTRRMALAHLIKLRDQAIKDAGLDVWCPPRAARKERALTLSQIESRLAALEREVF